MFILLEVLILAASALLVSKFAPEPWRSRILSVVKAYFTVRAFRLLLSHPIAMEDGTKVIAWKLIADQLGRIDATTFWTFLGIATGVKVIGMLASMYRWILVLQGQGIQLPFRHIFGSFLIGRAIGTFLPSTAGLDGYTLYDAARFSGQTVEVSAAKFLEKICGFSGVFLTFLVALPFGISIFGDNALLFASLSIPLALGIIGGLLLVLWYPGVVQWLLANLPIPGKDRLTGLLTRITTAAGAYRDKKRLMLMVLFMSFLVHFTTAAMYYFTALAIGATGADFWQVTFGSSIQIFATVLSPFTIAGEGIREAAQYVLLGSLIGPAAAIVSAALGFWAAEAPTMLGFIFWWVRGKDYTPAFCLVDGVQVDYAEAAKAAVALETEEEKAQRERAEAASGRVEVPLTQRVVQSALAGLSAGLLAGVVIGVVESLVIAQGGFGGEAQVLWYGPLAYAAILGGLALLGGAVLGFLPMDEEEIQSWVPTLGLIGTLIPFALAIAVFRLRRDVYLEQMPPPSVLLGVLAGFGVVTLLIFFGGRKLFAGPLRFLGQPKGAGSVLAVVVIIGFFVSMSVGSAAPGAGRGEIPSALRSVPNIILVAVDTLRADYLSCYGGEVEAPNICSLIEDGGTRFEAFSHASWTKPATATLLTSLLPSTHRAIAKPSVLSPDVEMVAEVMQDRGYTTGGVVSNINLADSFGFNQGYDEYYFLGPDYLALAEESSSKLIVYNIVRAVWFKVKPGIRASDFYQDSETVNEVAIDWLERNAQDRFFLFLHYMDPHDPYFRHPYDGHGIARVSNQHPSPEIAEEMRELYKGEIEFLDENFGRFLDKLRALGLYDNTVIALTADHGEEFYDHGGFWHGLTLYDEQIRVPLLVKWANGVEPPSAGATDGLARLLDVVPTLIQVSGGDVPEAMQGVDLRSDVESRSVRDRQHFAEEDHEGNVLWSLRTDQMKLIAANPGNPRGLPEQELFEVAIDPGEGQPLSLDQNASTVQTLADHADLQRRAAEGEAVEDAGEVEMTFEECEQLRMLGYVDDCSHLGQ